MQNTTPTTEINLTTFPHRRYNCPCLASLSATYKHIDMAKEQRKLRRAALNLRRKLNFSCHLYALARLEQSRANGEDGGNGNNLGDEDILVWFEKFKRFEMAEEQHRALRTTHSRNRKRNFAKHQYALARLHQSRAQAITDGETREERGGSEVKAKEEEILEWFDRGREQREEDVWDRMGIRENEEDRLERGLKRGLGLLVGGQREENAWDRMEKEESESESLESRMKRRLGLTV
ncbi:hypothetical protein B0J14DRAFT_634585 [Halenospora varia]|nr:hypothetical protein B0J14DRAFT_634585 [Halenospora varia]